MVSYCSPAFPSRTECDTAGFAPCADTCADTNVKNLLLWHQSYSADEAEEAKRREYLGLVDQFRLDQGGLDMARAYGKTTEKLLKERRPAYFWGYGLLQGNIQAGKDNKLNGEEGKC